MALPFAGDVEFQKLIQRREDVDLVRLMLEFCADAYPDVDSWGTMEEIERLGQLAAERLASPACHGAEKQLKAISRLLYDDEGYHGNESSYYDPRNSYLNEVLASRCGIPISLALVYMAVARRAGLDVYGVPTPGHFVLGCDTPRGTLYVDPFSGGDVLRRDACRRRIERIVGQTGAITDEHFHRATALEIALRVLRNLKAAYAMKNEWDSALPVQLRLAMLLPDVADEQRDLGLVYLRNGRAQPALALLENYVRACTAEQAKIVEPYLRSARRLVAELN